MGGSTKQALLQALSAAEGAISQASSWPKRWA